VWYLGLNEHCNLDGKGYLNEWNQWISLSEVCISHMSLEEHDQTSRRKQGGKGDRMQFCCWLIPGQNARGFILCCPLYWSLALGPMMSTIEGTPNSRVCYLLLSD
jgi:hypothetical protein